MLANRPFQNVIRVKREIVSPPLKEGGEIMKTTDFEQSKQHAFDSFCKKILRNEAYNFYAEVKRQRQRETIFSELSERELAQLFVSEAYPSEQNSFSVFGYDIVIKSDLLADALAALTMQKRDILLLYHSLGMTDREIGDLLHMPRQTVQYHRTSAMQQLKKYMEKKVDE